MNGHQFEITGKRRLCTKCLRPAHEANKSRRLCPGIPWYKSGQAPANLYTKGQLKVSGLQPARDQQPAGIVIATMHHEVIWLYDINQTRPRRQDTSAMQAARAQTWAKTAEKWACEHCGAKPENFGELVHWWIKPGVCEECGEMLKKQAQADRLEAKFDRDRKAACKWAHDLMRRQDWAIVDTETSGIRGIVLDLAAIAPDGRELFNSLVHADGATIEPGARAVHQITDQELEQAPKLPEIWPAFQRSLEHCTTIVAYNSTFDQARIDQSARRYSLPALAQEWQCAMLEYARYYGDWNSYYGSYRWQKLPGAGHRAIADARATLELIKRMAAEHQEAAARSKPSNE